MASRNDCPPRDNLRPIQDPDFVFSVCLPLAIPFLPVPLEFTLIIPPLAAFLVTLMLTPVVKWASRRFSLIDHQLAETWHTIPTPHFGGIAMSTGILVSMALAGIHVYLILGTLLIFTVGLLDDFFSLPPSVRVVVELVGALLVLVGGMDYIDPFSANGLLALVWIVLVSNAINLIDGADGVAGSVVGAATLIGGLFLASIGEVQLATMMFTLTAVCVAFLFFNWPPASIFMGDSGSLVLGYLLALFSLETGHLISGDSIGLQYAVAFAFVAVPFLDASFVAMIRILVGRNPAKGGTHHIHHRIRMLGFSSRQTASVLAILAGLFVCSIFLVTREQALFLVLVLFGLTALLLFEVLLVHHTGFLPSKDGETVERQYLLRLGSLIKGFSPLPKVIADSAVVTMGVITASALTETGPTSISGDFQMVGLFVVVKLIIFWIFRLYRLQWLTNAGTPDLLRSIGAMMVGSAVLAVLAVYLPSLNVGSRLIAVDFMATSMGIIGLRVGYRAFRSVMGTQQRGGRRALIYGAGQGGGFAVREMRLNPKHKMYPIGFLDDDPIKLRSRNYGLTVLGSAMDVENVVKRVGAEQIVISTDKIEPERLQLIMDAAERMDIPCTLMQFSFDSVFSLKPNPVEEEEWLQASEGT